jgi:PleD family two-component response regulator
MTELKAAAKPATILIVDDDPHTLEILRRWLKREGYETVSAESGAACLDALRNNAIDVIVLDVMMPNMDGLEVCEKLREDEALRFIPVILLTAKDDMETRSRGMTLGVSEYLTKPVNKEDLFARIRAQVHSRELDRKMGETAAAVSGMGRSE